MKSKPVHTNVIMAGFGGQGLMFIGKLLAYCCMKSGLQVTWIPSYGPEMRGGTANCTVVISDEPIGSPVISSPDALIVMNNPSLEAFERKLKPGGLLFINSNLVTGQVQRRDIEVIPVPANDAAVHAGAKQSANMVMLGAYLARTGVVGKKIVEQGLPEFFKAKAESLEANIKALEEGFEHAQAKTAAG